MRGSFIFQTLLALVGLSLAVSSLLYLQESLFSGLLGAIGGVLIILGAIVAFLRQKRTTTHS